MAFSSGSLGGGGDDIPPMAEINIIPLVDVMLVLLIITMVTAPFMEQGLNIDLPVTQQGQSLEKNANEQKDPVFLYISKEKGLMLGSEKITREQLPTKLANAFKDRADKEVFVKADRIIPYGEVADVMTRVQSAGITKVGLVTVPE